MSGMWYDKEGYKEQFKDDYDEKTLEPVNGLGKNVNEIFWIRLVTRYNMESDNNEDMFLFDVDGEQYKSATFTDDEDKASVLRNVADAIDNAKKGINP
jgi:hypothetical protein